MLDLPECFGIEAAIEDTVMEQHYDGFDKEQRGLCMCLNQFGR